MAQMPIGTAITGLTVVTTKLSRILVWCVFTITHLVLAFAAVALLWWLQATPEEVVRWAQTLAPSWLASTTLGIFAFLGLSGFAVLWAYVRAWRWLLHKMLSAFLFSD